MILLSFDIEEFDTPVEYGAEISFEQQMAVSADGAKSILNVLHDNNIHATFFCTANFATHAPLEIIQQMHTNGNEIASHGYYHSWFDLKHLKESKDELESITGKEVKGYRMARMMPFDETELVKAGYSYNTSLNPTFLPGRYNNFKKPATWHYSNGMLQIPASVTPILRIPLFWLALHNFPFSIYVRLCKLTLKKYGYLNLYYHPWEFSDEILNKEKYNMPFYIRRNAGRKMAQRLSRLIQILKDENQEFLTFSEFIEREISK
jgi:peptidoglycan/xylan/chitin deacetylase (PgdA/CDA1 family)